MEHKKFKVKSSWAIDFETGLATFHYSALKISKPYAIFIQEEYSGSVLVTSYTTQINDDRFYIYGREFNGTTYSLLSGRKYLHVLFVFL